MSQQNLEEYIQEAMMAFPKECKLLRTSMEGEMYWYLYYDFDEVNEWYAEWLQDFIQKYGGQKDAEV